MASIWIELKRRNVIRVAVAYAVVGWLLIEVTSTVLPIFEAPQWALQTITFAIILGFPLALILSWMFDLTPSGMERTRSGSDPRSTSPATGRRLNFVIIGALVAALGFVVYNYVLNTPAANTLAGDDRRSIAALPFSNESAAAENAEFLANGIHDELLTQLAKIASLKVISRTSVMDYRDSPKNMRQIGQELGVATLLEGRVQRSGDMVRINVQLIDADTDEHIWAEIYNRELTAQNIFAIQSEMATAIADALQATLLPEEVARLNEVPTQSAEAWQFYQIAKDYTRDPDESAGMPLAIQQYERALEEDPDFALAWAGLSRAHSENRNFEAAEAAVQKAFELEPGLPEAHVALGTYYYWRFRDYTRALEEYAIAERSMPGSADVISSRASAYRRAGRWNDAIETWNRAMQLDPRNFEDLILIGRLHLTLRNYSEAERVFTRAQEIAPHDDIAYLENAQIALYRDGDAESFRAAIQDAPMELGFSGDFFRWYAALFERDYDSAVRFLDGWNTDAFFSMPKDSLYGITYKLSGQPELAERYFQMALEQVPTEAEISDDDNRSYVPLAEVLAGLGEVEEAQRLGRLELERFPATRDAYYAPTAHYNVITRVLALAGATETVLAELEVYLSGPGRWSVEGFSADPVFDFVRSDPRFQALVERYRSP